MKMLKRVLAPIGVMAGGAMALYFLVYAIGSSSEPFEYAEAAIKASPEIRAIVGEVEDVSLKPLKGLRYRTRSEGRGDADMSLLVSGSKREAMIKVTFRRHQGVWSLTQATLDGQPVNLR